MKRIPEIGRASLEKEEYKRREIIQLNLLYARMFFSKNKPPWRWWHGTRGTIRCSEGAHYLVETDGYWVCTLWWESRCPMESTFHLLIHICINSVCKLYFVTNTWIMKLYFLRLEYLFYIHGYNMHVYLLTVVGICWKNTTI